MAKKNKVPLVLAIIAGVLVIGALVYIFGFTSARDIFSRGKAERALLSGKLEVASEQEINDYFVFLPAEEVKTLLSESGGKYLFPQVEFLLASGESLTVKSEDVSVDNTQFKFLTISGLSSGAKIYSTGGGIVRGGVVPNGTDSYAWMKEARAEEGNNETIFTIFPISDTEAISSLTFSAEIAENMYSPVEYGDQLASLLTDNVIPESWVPGGADIAVAIAGEDGVYTKLGLENILTKDGRIVMIQR